MPIPAALLLLCAALVASCAQPDRVQPGADPSGQNLVVLSGDGELVETERTPAYSVMQVRRAPAGSVPSAMYALRGACAVLRARGANYVESERVAGAPATYRLTFPTSPAPERLSGASKSIFTLGECTALRF